MTTPFAAANAYGSIADIGADKKPKLNLPSIGMDEAETPKFGDMVQDSLGGFIAQGQKLESSVLKSTMDKSNLVSLVTDVSETEMKLSTIVALRDKVIDAYEKIMNMPV